jgi:signal transduction histidine kinase/HPt (histidine-containing phosphotransfer) domain-containing protein/ActR/RegA family two-component response regulator
MQQLSDLISRREVWLMDQTIAYAKQYGYMPYTSTLAEAWRASICGLSGPLIKALAYYDEAPQLIAGEYAEESITAFGIEAARRHRSRGITLGLFLGLMKYYRQSYLDLLELGELPAENLPRYREFVTRFFDRVEIGFCSEWASQNESELVLEARKKNRTLTHEKNKYLTIFESLKDPVVLLDTAGRIDNTNQAAAELFGGSSVPGAGYYGVNRLPLLEGALATLAGKSGEHVLSTSLGSRCFEVKSKTMLDVSEKFAGTVLILSDVTDYKRASQEAEQANRTKSAFLATVSHEIRTPINGIVGMTALLKDTSLNEKQASYVATIATSGEILSSLIADILDYSKIEAGVLELEYIDFSVEALINDVLTLMVPAATAKGLSLVARVEPKLPEMVSGDFNKLRQILLNLVGNAVKFTERGLIELGAEASGPWLRFSVKDSGIGISESGRVNLFTAFAQADSSVSRKFGGTGLGLAICHRLVTAMGGEIGLESKVDQGSCFRFKIPLTPSKVNGRTSLSFQKPNELSLNCLVVEDDEVNRIVACGLLEKFGHHVSSVISGSLALALLETRSFDLILMDLNLPGLSGLETIRSIRANKDPSVARVPVVVVSAFVTKDAIQDSLNAGANAFLGKPYRPERLETAIRTVLLPDISVSDKAGPPVFRQGDDKGIQSEEDEGVMTRLVSELGFELTQKIIEAFIDTAPETLEQAKLGLREGDFQLVLQAAHRMKSSASTIGFGSLADLAATLEAAASDGHKDKIAILMAELERRVPVVSERLKRFRDDPQRQSATST